MIEFPNRLMRIFALLLSLTAAAAAQDAKIILRTLAIGEAKFPALLVKEKSSYLPLAFSAVQPSAPVKADRISPLPLFPEIPEGAGKKQKPPYFVKLPDSGRVLLLGWMAGEKPRFLALPDYTSKGKADEWAVINFTSKDIAIKLGNDRKPTLFKSSVSGAIKLSSPVGQGIAVSMATEEEGVWKIFYSTYWPVYADQRGLVLAYDLDGKVKIKLIFDQIVKDEAP